MSEDDIWKRLREPFRVEEIKWRVGNIARSGTSTTLLAYIDARCAFDRFDEVVGPDKWRNSYRAGPIGGVLCKIEILVGGEWVGKEDGADGTHIEATKGGYSDAFKRTAVLWGPARYLYNLPTKWYNVKQGRSPEGAVNIYRKEDPRKKLCEVKGYCDRPQLPQWALHSKDKPLKKQKRNKTEADANKERQAFHDPSWHDSVQGWRMFCENKLGASMNDVSDFLTKLKKKRPSNMNEAERTEEAKWLDSDEGRARFVQYKEWKAGGDKGKAVANNSTPKEGQ